MGYLHCQPRPQARLGSRRLVRRDDGVQEACVTYVQAATVLSLLFLVVYGGTNWFTTLRSDVGTWHFDWELGIPLVPLFIVPYMSIDLFFVAAPFLCRSRAELRTFTRRIVFAIVVAGGCFLLVPLRLGFERTPVPGTLGSLFDSFRTMDAPHNLFPSLHVTLGFLLAEVYVRRTQGLLRAALVVWFTVISFSTVLTHQHHLVDVAGGMLLALVACYLFREESTPSPVVPNHVGAYYFIGAGLMSLGSVAFWPYGSVFLWPAVSLAVSAAAYWGLGPGIFRKHEGRLPLAARVLLAPVLFGHHLSLVYYRRRSPAYSEVVPGVLMGRQLTEAEATKACAQGVTAVLDLAAEFTEAAPFRQLHYFALPILDLTAPTDEQIRQAVHFIETAAARGSVYVHCKVGYSRSAAVVGAYLLATGRARSEEEAIAHMRKARPGLIVRAEVKELLRRFAGRIGAGAKRAT